MSDKTKQSPPASAIGRERADLARRPRRMYSTELLGCEGELIIEHAGREYRLRLTSNGKLILTA